MTSRRMNHYGQYANNKHIAKEALAIKYILQRVYSLAVHC